MKDDEMQVIRRGTKERVAREASTRDERACREAELPPCRGGSGRGHGWEKESEGGSSGPRPDCALAADSASFRVAAQHHPALARLYSGRYSGREGAANARSHPKQPRRTTLAALQPPVALGADSRAAQPLESRSLLPLPLSSLASSVSSSVCSEFRGPRGWLGWDFNWSHLRE